MRYTYGASVEDALEKLQFDLFYIKHQSLWLDLVILIKTIGLFRAKAKNVVALSRLDRKSVV